MSAGRPDVAAVASAIAAVHEAPYGEPDRAALARLVGYREAVIEAGRTSSGAQNPMMGIQVALHELLGLKAILAGELFTGADALQEILTALDAGAEGEAEARRLAALAWRGGDRVRLEAALVAYAADACPVVSGALGIIAWKRGKPMALLLNALSMEDASEVLERGEEPGFAVGAEPGPAIVRPTTLYRGARLKGTDYSLGDAAAAIDWTTDRAVAERFAHAHFKIMGGEPVVLETVATPDDVICTTEQECEVLLRWNPDRAVRAVG